VKGFLRSANDMLSKNGEAHVTHKTAHPFDRWEIEKLAEDVGLCLIE
jgi:25S rRNA (uracil2634-N3)-methyltransferase